MFSATLLNFMIKNWNVKIQQMPYLHWIFGQIKSGKQLWRYTSTLKFDHFYVFLFVFEAKTHISKGKLIRSKFYKNMIWISRIECNELNAVTFLSHNHIVIDQLLECNCIGLYRSNIISFDSTENICILADKGLALSWENCFHGAEFIQQCA